LGRAGGVVTGHVRVRSRAWSIGPLRHLEKEAREAQQSPDDLAEKADCLFLIFDATRRSGKTLDELLDAAFAKLAINKERAWQNARSRRSNRTRQSMSHTYLSYVPAFPKPSQVKRELPHVKVFPDGREFIRCRKDKPEGAEGRAEYKRRKDACGSARGASAASTGSCLSVPASCSSRTVLSSTRMGAGREAGRPDRIAGRNLDKRRLPSALQRGERVQAHPIQPSEERTCHSKST